MKLGHRVSVRSYAASDEPGLLRLAAACAMEGDVGLCVQRKPEFVALNRLVSDVWQLGVVEDPEGEVAGSIAIARRNVFINGRPQQANYVSDLKVLPQHRTPEVALSLIRWAQRVCAIDADNVPTVVAVLAGNASIERRFAQRNDGRLQRIATVRSHSVGILWPRRESTCGLSVSNASRADVSEMLALWRRVAPMRQFAPVFEDEERFLSWIERAPGLSIDDYLLARRADGRLTGFVGLWDSSDLKQTIVTSYSTSLRIFRSVFNQIAPRVGGVPLPAMGGKLPLVSGLHLCVAPDDVSVDVARTLVLAAYRSLRGTGKAFFTIGLDVRDPLNAAFKNLFAQPTDTSLCFALPVRGVTASLDGRPIYHEIALV